MKRSTAIFVALGTIVSVAVVGIGAGVSQGADRNTSCWDEYNLRGTRKFRTVVSADIPIEDCTPGAGCYFGYRETDGKKNRQYVPHGMSPTEACNVISPPTTPCPAPV